MKKIIAFILLFLLGLGLIYYLPIIKKGYPFAIDTYNLILARNLHLTGQYSMEDKNNVLLSSANIKDQGILTDPANKMTPLIYAKIFDWLGFKPNLPLYFSIICFVIVNILFFILILKRFNLSLAAIFSLTLGFIPIFWQGALVGGFYEFALLFFALGILSYFYREKNNLVDLFISGLFFGLAITARNAFLISIAAFLIFELLQNRSFKRIIVFSLPIILIFIFLVFPHNLYLKSSESFAIYGHAFPDPYTYIFSKNDYMNEVAKEASGEMLGWVDLYGFRPTFTQKLKIYLTSAPPFIFKNFFLPNTFAGPLILALLILGLAWAKYKFKNFYLLFITWFTVWFISLTVVGATNWDHFLEILFPVVLSISFGIFWLVEVIKQVFTERRIKIFIFSVLAIGFVGQLVVADKWMFHEEYSASKMQDALVLVDQINKAGINNKDVIAFGGHNSTMDLINYYSNVSIVKFDPTTIQNLLAKGELQQAFDYFGITAIAGYEPSLVKEVIKNISIKVIDSES